MNIIKKLRASIRLNEAVGEEEKKKGEKLPPNTDIKVYRNLLPDKWKENRSRIET